MKRGSSSLECSQSLKLAKFEPPKEMFKDSLQSFLSFVLCQKKTFPQQPLSRDIIAKLWFDFVCPYSKVVDQNSREDKCYCAKGCKNFYEKDCCGPEWDVCCSGIVCCCIHYIDRKICCQSCASWKEDFVI